jgi:hypothetical protein
MNHKVISKKLVFLVKRVIRVQTQVCTLPHQNMKNRSVFRATKKSFNT